MRGTGSDNDLVYSDKRTANSGRLTSVVLSIDSRDDAIVYGSCLKEYLEREFLPT
jgi:hypothetical protein